MSKELFEAARGAVRSVLTDAAQMHEEDADTVINGLLDAMADLIADKVSQDVGHIRYGSATDYADRHEALIRDWRSW